jgi:CRISPR-associated endonuclease/helicase Cas3
MRGGHIASHRFWGKLDTRVAPAGIHPLVDHCIDVALTFRRIVEVPAFQQRLEAVSGAGLRAEQLDRLAVVALLHDLGKCNRGFQAKQDPQAKETAGHVIEAAALLLDDELQALWPPSLQELVATLCEWFSGGANQARAMLFAAVSHHGRPVSFDDIGNHPAAPRMRRSTHRCFSARPSPPRLLSA